MGYEKQGEQLYRESKESQEDMEMGVVREVGQAAEGKICKNKRKRSD